MTAALGFAFAAGLVATVNPCGFAMLPAYLSYFMGLDDSNRGSGGALRSALVVGAVVSAGFLLVFGLAGIVISAGFRAVTGWIPWMALGIGAVVAVLGVAMLFGYELRVGLPKAKRANTDGGWGSMLGFGVGYGVASLSCTLPVFLVAVTGQLASRSLLEGLAVFAAYGAGMAVMLLSVTIVLALGKQGLVNRLRASARHINRISGAILVAAGAFIVWFWTTEITSGAGALGSSGAFQVVERIQSSILNFVADNTVLVGLAGVGVVAAAALWALRTRDRAEHIQPPEDQDGPDAGHSVPEPQHAST